MPQDATPSITHPRATFIDRLGAVLAGISILIWTAACAICALVALLFSPALGHRVHRIWGRGFCWIFGIRVEITGLENLAHPGGGILAANHQSLFDIPILASLPVDFRWVSKAEVGRIPLMGPVMRRMGCYFLRRNHSSQDLDTMRQVEEDLQRGTRILIFPEGTRTRTGAMLPFKRGAFRTSIHSGVPLYPIAISGSFAIAPPETFPARRGHLVHIDIAPGIRPPKDLAPDMILSSLTNEYRRILETMLSKR